MFRLSTEIDLSVEVQRATTYSGSNLQKRPASAEGSIYLITGVLGGKGGGGGLKELPF